MELRILSGGAANGLVDALRPALRDRGGAEISGDFGAVGGMRDRIVAGEAVDLVILTRAVVDELAAQGRVEAETVVDVGAVVTGIGVREGAPRPDISDGDALREAFRGADGLYCPDTAKATAGIHLARVLDDLGIGREMADRIREFPNGQTAMAEMAASGGSRAIGCTQVTEILNTAGVDHVGPLPPPHDLSTTYTAAIAAKAASPDLGRALIALLTAPENAALRRETGFT